MPLDVARHQQPVPVQESFFQPDEGVLFVSNLTYQRSEAIPLSFPSQQPQVGFCFLHRVVDAAGIACRADCVDCVRRRGENFMRFLCLGLENMKAAISFK